MPTTIKVPQVQGELPVVAAKVIKGDYSLRYWDEMTRPGVSAAFRVFPPGGEICTIGAGNITFTDLAPGERSVVWCRDTNNRVVAAKLVVGGKRYTTSSDPSWIDPEPGSIRSRPSTYAPPATTVADNPV